MADAKTTWDYFISPSSICFQKIGLLGSVKYVLENFFEKSSIKKRLKSFWSNLVPLVAYILGLDAASHNLNFNLCLFRTTIKTVLFL